MLFFVRLTTTYRAKELDAYRQSFLLTIPCPDIWTFRANIKVYRRGTKIKYD